MKILPMVPTGARGASARTLATATTIDRGGGFLGLSGGKAQVN